MSRLSEEGSVSLCLKNTFLEIPIPASLRPLRLSRSLTCPAELVHPIECVSTDASDLSDAETLLSPVEESEFTTVMLRHIPNKYSQTDLLRVLDSKGFRTRYDFFYLPADFRSQSNCGYAFINFRSPHDAADFARVFRGFRLPALRSSKVCDVSWARIQGLASNVEHYRNNPINSLSDDFFKPLLFNLAGVRVSFPKPDRPSSCPFLAPASVPAGPAGGGTGRTEGRGRGAVGGKIFIGGLSPETTERELEEYFGRFGSIAEAAIVADKKSGMSRGFGFCCFEEAVAVDRVLGVRQHLVLGQSVGVRRYAKTNNVH